MNKIKYKRVLFIGPDCKQPKGGIASVLHTYSMIFCPFNFIASTKGGGMIRLFGCFILAFFKFIYYILNLRIKIIHIHGASYGSFWRKAVFILTAKIFRKKVIYHMHGGAFRVFAAKHTKIVPFILKKCDIIIALSEYWRSYFKDEMKCKNVAVVPNIIETPNEDHSIRPTDICNFLFLGKICDNKGIFDLIDVISKNKKKYVHRMNLYIGGEGEVARLKKIISEYKLDDIIKYVGFVSGERKVELLNKSHVYILPSYIEGLPISILEAMSYHLPVISTNVGGIPEILHDGVEGLVVEPGNRREIAEAIDAIISSEKIRNEMGCNGFKESINHFPSEVEKELNKLYSSLL
jgi:glycosyltransferase involved in cell wall biosynthesis